MMIHVAPYKGFLGRALLVYSFYSYCGIGITEHTEYTEYTEYTE